MKNLKITRRAKMVILSVAFAVVVMVFVACASRCDKRGENETPTVTPTNTIVPATATPTQELTSTPTLEPTATQAPTDTPTPTPTVEPTDTPTQEPTETPTPEPTDEPTPEPTATPTSTPTPIVEPTKPATPTPKPATPTPKPATPTPTVKPTEKPATPTPTVEVKPTDTPTPTPTNEPTKPVTPEPTQPTEPVYDRAKAEAYLNNVYTYHIAPYINGATLISKNMSFGNKYVIVNGEYFPIHKVSMSFMLNESKMIAFTFYIDGLQYQSGWGYADNLQIESWSRSGVEWSIVEQNWVGVGDPEKGGARNGIGSLFQ